MAVKSTAKKVNKAKVAAKPAVKSPVKRPPSAKAKSSLRTLTTARKQAAVKDKSVVKSLKFQKSHVLLVVAIVLVGASLYFFRSLFVAAVVNGQPISRLEVVRETEKQKGKATLDSLVRNTLIEQEAQRQKVKVGDKEVNDEIKKLEETLTKQGQKLDDVLAMQEMTRGDLQRLIRLDKLVSKMVGKDVKVTDKEVDEYLEKNKDLLPADEDQAKVKNDIKERLRQQKTAEKVRTWLADLEKKAKVIRFVQY